MYLFLPVQITKHFIHRNLANSVGLVVHPNLVKKDDYTGEFQTITLANGVKVKIPIVMVDIHSK